MRKTLTETERLDLAASVLLPKFSLPAARMYITLGSAVFVALGIWAHDSYYDPVRSHICAAVIVAVTVLAWLPWRYRFHMTAMILIAWAANFAWPDIRPRPQTIFGWFARVGALGVWLIWISPLWQISNRRLRVADQVLEAECNQVEAWLQLLTGPKIPEGLIDFRGGSYGRGFARYRLLKVGDRWAVATCMNTKGPNLSAVQYRIYDSDGVSVAMLPSGNADIRIGKRTFANVDLAYKWVLR